jgi:chemotaxis methyl-accepting protein methylase
MLSSSDGGSHGNRGCGACDCEDWDRSSAHAFSTVFLRNRAELELIGRPPKVKSTGATVRVAVLGCSTGARAYSVAWRIRSARPDLKVILDAVDISKKAVEIADGVFTR